MRRFILTVPILLLLPGMLFPQQQDEGFEESVKKLAADGAKAYVAPIVSGFGVNLNSGWFHRAPWATKLGFDLEFGVVGMATLFQDAHKTFSSSGSFKFDYDQADFLAQQAIQQSGGSIPAGFQTDIRNAIRSQLFDVSFSGPTIIGSSTDSMKVSFPGKTIPVSGVGQVALPSEVFVLPATGLLEDANAFPLGAPQLTIGTLFGTQFTFRYLPEVKIDDQVGSLKYFGFGIQHNPMVWLSENPLPFEVAVGYFTQSLKIGSFMEANATAFGLSSSIRLGWGFLNITPYAGFMIESSDITFGYDYSIAGPPGTLPVTDRVTFTATGENKSRFTLGASVTILIVNVNADISFGTYKAISGGVMIII